MCNHFLSPFDIDSQDLCICCCGQQCSIDVLCKHCTEWPVEEWNCVQSHIDKLAEQPERKRERKVLSKSFFFGFLSPHSLLSMVTKLSSKPVAIGRHSLSSGCSFENTDVALMSCDITLCYDIFGCKQSSYYQ